MTHKIIALEAENYKRLKAVNIEPDETFQVIGGNNGEGKSSVLDSIWAALGGKDAAKGISKPIRDGEKKARVSVDLGDLVVTRVWTANDRSTLKVTPKDSKASFPSPQSMLDELIGRFSFDPLAFTALSAKEQRDQLVQLVELPFDPDALDEERRSLYADRTDIGRDLKTAKGYFDSLPQVPADTPDDEVSMADMLAIRERAVARQHEAEELEAVKERIKEYEEALAAAMKRLAGLEQSVAEAPEIESVEDVDARIATVEDTNRLVRAKARRTEAGERVHALQSEYDVRTDEINAIDIRKAECLAAAQFPVEGLAFDEEGVTYQGVPFSQASSAEQIRVSMGIAMALNPKLRVIRIMDGSLLDAKSMETIKTMAEEGDFQVLVERVGSDDEMAIIIDDGEVSPF